MTKLILPKRARGHLKPVKELKKAKTSHEKMMLTILRLKDEGWSDDDIIIGLQQHKRLSLGMATMAVISALRTRGVNCHLVGDGDETGEVRWSIGYSKPHLRVVVND